MDMQNHDGINTFKCHYQAQISFQNNFSLLSRITSKYETSGGAHLRG